MNNLMKLAKTQRVEAGREEEEEEMREQEEEAKS
jgi:hypothetical protein